MMICQRSCSENFAINAQHSQNILLIIPADQTMGCLDHLSAHLVVSLELSCRIKSNHITGFLITNSRVLKRRQQHYQDQEFLPDHLQSLAPTASMRIAELWGFHAISQIEVVEPAGIDSEPPHFCSNKSSTCCCVSLFVLGGCPNQTQTSVNVRKKHSISIKQFHAILQ